MKPGGRLVVSDLVSGTAIPEVLGQFPDVISGCLPVPQQDYLAGLEAAGFVDIEVTQVRPFAEDRLPVNPDVLKRVEEAGGALGELAAFTRSAASAIIRARKA